jgi:VWFA-related protein
MAAKAESVQSLPVFRSVTLIVLLSLLATGSVVQETTFQVASRLVQINVIVHDKHGPVMNLTKDDFVLSDRGAGRKIVVFAVQSASAADVVTPLPPHTFADFQHGEGGAPRGITIVLLDELNTLRRSAALPDEAQDLWNQDHALADAKQQLMKFVRQMDSNDRVAPYSLVRTLRVLCDFTNDRNELLTVLGKYQARSLTSREVVEPGSIHTAAPGDFNATFDRERRALAGVVNASRTAATMTALMQIAGHVANVPGRKSLV